MIADARESTVSAFLRRGRLRPLEALPWLAAGLFFFAAPQHLTLGAQLLVLILFVLSLDLLVGYAGIVTLGHAAFYGAGAYAAGMLSVWGGVSDAFSGLALGGASGAALGLASGLLMLRTRGLSLLILSLALLLVLQEAANQGGRYTGGADGLSGISLDPLFGRYPFGMSGQVMYLYALGIVFVCWAALRFLLTTPFGRSLVGIRENPTRMAAIGVDVRRRELAAFTISAGLAGIAGALATEVDQFVSPTVLSFELSGTALVVLVLGGVGRLYGAFVGAPVYVLAQDLLAKDDPVYWNFWLGLILVLVVLLARGGVLGLVSRLAGSLVRNGAWARFLAGGRR